ncbi:MAG: hypothetical protein HYU67_02190 [Flavobacteriia bacterium]|nr:hypothetical protein [Flavobacteriia bacterium]
MAFVKYFIFCFFTSITYSQISFFKKLINEESDRAEGAVQLPDSSYLITGSSSSYLPSNKQCFILKIDSLGNVKWSKDYGGSEADKGRRIFYVPNDGVYVFGQTNSFGANFFDIYVFKTDFEGNLLWENIIGGVGYEDIYDAVILKDTSFILVGESTSNSNEDENVYILRVNRFGQKIWDKNIDNYGVDRAMSIKMYNDTTAFIVGESYQNVWQKTFGFLSKMHINGTIDWTKYYENKDKLVFNDMNIKNDTIRIAGYTKDYFENEHKNLYLSSHDINGETILINIEYRYYAVSCEFIENYENDFLILRAMEGEAEFIYNYGLDAKAYRYNGDLYFLSVYFDLSYLYEDVINDVISTSDGGILYVGYATNPYDGGENVLIMKIAKGNNFQSYISRNL